MKITKRKLRRIIREALNRRALNESHPYDAGIEEYVKLRGHGTYAVNYIRVRMKDAIDRDIMNLIWHGDYDGPGRWKDLLKEIPDEAKDREMEHLNQELRSIRSNTGATKQNKKETHPYDASINDAVDAGYFSNSDAVDEVQDHLRSAGAIDLVDEIEMMVNYGDDDIYDILAMIPKAIKDKLPVG